ncbi:zinc ribbon domain-containing protein [Desulfonatronovibrio magnus]|uniref:zinc ribbon domain-containing protein n=1 Tax=Desulfonatronovibrio magnus TaxID=698827 RepID=UPI0005EBA374
MSRDHACISCERKVPDDAKFCGHCGQQQVVFSKCDNCDRDLDPDARFCSGCGSAVEQKPSQRLCSQCKTQNLPESLFCNQCGEKL